MKLEELSDEDYGISPAALMAKWPDINERTICDRTFWPVEFFKAVS